VRFFIGRASETNDSTQFQKRNRRIEIGDWGMVMGRRDEIIVIMVIIGIIRAYRKITRRRRPLSSPSFL